MKKQIAFLLCLLMILSLFSCESNEDLAEPLSSDNITSHLSEAEIAMEMYEAAIKGEIRVFDELLGEGKLEDCLFLSSNLLLGECEILSKAILDIDGDGINEYVIQSEENDHILLHYYNGKVYSYSFDRSNFYNLNTDGSFYWADNWSNDAEGEISVHGLNRVTFNGSSLNVK